MEDGPAKPWHVAFLVRDYPTALRTLGPTHFNGQIDQNFLDNLRATKERKILHFLGGDPPRRFLWVAFLVDAQTRLDAVSEALHRMNGLIDGASFWGDNERPEIGAFAWVGEISDDDLLIVSYGQQLWIEFLEQGGESRGAWEHRNRELQAHINPFFSLAIDLHSRAMTPLAQQIRYSMRMFRHGKHSGSWGVEFICKFCALEGLVCGDERGRKGEKLRTRLSALFRDNSPEFAGRIEKLWRYRSEAVHTARAFDSGGLTDGAALGVHIADIEHFFVGAVVFALQNLSSSDQVADLWAQVGDYTLPDFARIERPRDFPRYAVPMMEMPLPFGLKDGGIIVRRHLAAARAKYEEVNAPSGLETKRL